MKAAIDNNNVKSRGPAGTAASAFAPLLFTAIWLFFMIAGQTRLFRDPGTQWHTAVGERVLAQGFTTDEPYSFTKSRERWIPHQWLGEVAMALAFRVAAFDTYLFITATAYAALFTWLIVCLLRTGLNFAVAILAGVLLIGTVATHIHVRPMLFTHFALAITMAMLIKFEFAGRAIDGHRSMPSRSQARPANTLLWLVPLYAFWTNIHGGMLGGVASIVLVVAGWIAFRLFGGPSPLMSLKPAMRVAIVIGLCGVTAFATPYGKGIFDVWLTILDQPRIGELIEEHQSLNPALPTAWPLLALALLYAFVFAGTLHRKPQVTWFLPLFWLLQSCQHVRHSPLFGLTAFLAIIVMWPHTRWAAWLAAHRPDVYDPAMPRPRTPRWAWLFPAALLGTTCALQIAEVKVPVIGRGWAGLDPNLWPVDLQEDLRAREPGRIFNECGYGGFLIMHAPGYKIFVDDRAELYGEAFLEDFIRGGSIDTPDALERWQTKYSAFDFALVKNDSGFDAAFANMPGWRLVKRGQVAALFEKK